MVRRVSPVATVLTLVEPHAQLLGLKRKIEPREELVVLKRSLRRGLRDIDSDAVLDVQNCTTRCVRQLHDKLQPRSGHSRGQLGWWRGQRDLKTRAGVETSLDLHARHTATDDSLLRAFPVSAPVKLDSLRSHINHIVEEHQLTRDRLTRTACADIQRRPAGREARIRVEALHIEDEVRVECFPRPVNDAAVPAVDTIHAVVINARRLLPSVGGVIHPFKEVWPVVDPVPTRHI